MKRKDSILLKYYSNKLPKHQMTGQVDYKKRQEENLQKSVDFLKDWYTKRATLPQFKNVSERRLNVLEQPIETRYWDPEILKAMGYSGGYSPRKKVLTLPDPNPSFADFPEYEKYMQHSTGVPLFMHEVFHKLHYEAPQFTDVVPEKITEKIPGYPELTSPEHISLSTGKIKTGFGKASTFYPEMEGITAMLRQAETIDPLKPVTPDDVNSYIKKYNKYDREIKLRDVDLDQSEDFHRGRLIKQLFDVLGNDPEKIAAYLNSVAKNDNQQNLSLAKWGGLTKYQIKGQVDNSRQPYLPYRVDYIDPRTGKPTSKFYESAEDADYFLNHGALKLVGPQGVQGYYEKPPRKKEVQVSPEEQARLNKQKAIEDTTKSFLEKWYNSPMHREMLKNSLNRGLGLFLDKRTDKMTQDRLKTLPGIKVNVAKMPEAIFDFSDISTLGYVDKDNPSLININAFSTVDDAKGTGVHEGSHLADYTAGIPIKDVKRMRRAASAPTDEYGEYMVGDKSGTETKARIYGGRYELEKAGIYNPFTEKLSKENFEKAEREIPEFKRTNDELRSIYSTDDILNFYNTISKSDNTQSQTMARYGFSVQSKQKALPKHQSIGEVTGKNCVGQCWKPTLSDKSGNSGGMFVGNTPISWKELLKYTDVDTKDKQFKKYLKDLQSRFPGLTQDQFLAARNDSFRIKGRIEDLPTWDKPENQTYDRAWYPFYRSLMQPNVRVTVPQILEFQSQQPGGLGGYQQMVESNYGKKKLRNGGLIKYQKKGQVSFSLPDPRDLQRQMMGSNESTSLGTKIDEAALRQASINRQRRNQGEIRQAGPERSAASKAWAIATHPMTALSYKVKGQDIPEQFERGERNPYDAALDIVNPLSYIDQARQVKEDVGQGNYLAAGIGALGLIPGEGAFEKKAGSLYLESLPKKFRGPNAYKIKLGDNWIGDFDLEKDADKWVIGNVGLKNEYRGKGLGKESFIKANELIKNKGEGLLHSSGIFHGEDAKNVWKSLVKEGKAEEIGKDAWRFKYANGGFATTETTTINPQVATLQNLLNDSAFINQMKNRSIPIELDPSRNTNFDANNPPPMDRKLEQGMTKNKTFNPFWDIPTNISTKSFNDFLQSEKYEEGGLYEYGPGGQTTDGCPAGYDKHPLTGECMPNGWVAPMQAGPTVQNAERLRRAAALNRGTTGPTIGQSRSDEPWRQRQAAEMRRQNAQESSALAQTMGSFTPSGYNPAAGVTGAETFVNMNPLITGPIMSTSRLYGAGRSMVDPNTYNPYFSSDKGVVSNILGGLNLAGDIGMLRMTLRNPTGSFNPRVRIATKTKPSDFTERNIRVKQAWADAKKKKAGVPTTAEEYRKFLQDEKLKQQAGDVLREKGMMPDPRTGGSYQAPADKLTWKDPKTGEIIYQLDAENYNDFKTPKDFKEAQQDFRSYKRKYLQDLANQRNAAVNEAKQLGIFGKQFPYDPTDFSKANLLGGRFPGFDIPDYIENLGFDYPMYYKDFTGATHNISGIDPSDLIPYKGLKVTKGLSPNQYGGLVKHQIKGQVQPTTADSLEVYNNAVAIRNYYDNLKKKGWYREPKVTNLSGLDKDSFKARMDYVKEKSLRTYRELLKRKKPSGGIFSNDKRHIEFDYFKNVYPNATYDDYIKAVGKSLVQTKAGTGDKYYYKDLFPSVIDPMAPSTLVNLKILPNEELRYSMYPNGDITYTTPPGGPFTGLYTYNPLSVKPAYLRSKQEEDEWQKKYGKSKIQTSKIQTSTTQKQKPQTPKPEEPKLKRKVSMMSPISTQSSYTPSLRMPNIPNIELPPVQSGNYMVGYFDENNQGVDRGFATPEQRDAFVEELRKRDLSGSQPYRGNITQYDRRGRREYGGLVKYQKRGQVNPPIYTDDPRKIKAYQDSLALSNWRFQFPYLITISQGIQYHNTNKERKEYVQSLNEYPWYLAGTSRQNNNLLNRINRTGYLPIGRERIEGELPVFKKPVQPYILQKPGLTRKVTEVQPISTSNTIDLGITPLDHPDVQPTGTVPQGKYRVEYYDPELKQETHRNFMTQAESDAFTNELSKRNLSGVPSAGNITQRVQYGDGGLVKYQKKGEVKKSPITHYIFAEQDSDNAFQTEANNLKTFISKNYPGENVVILPGRGDDYFNKTVLPTLGKVGKQDRVYLFGHHGSKYAGVPASLWGNAFEQAQKRAGDFNCYLGSCGASDLAGTDPDDWSIGNIDPAFSRLKNFYYRPETIDEGSNSGWYGVNPNAQAFPGSSQFGVLNAMYTRSANNPNVKKIRDARMNYIDSFYNKDKEYASLNKQAEQLYNQTLKDPKNEDIKKRLSETFEKIWYRRDTLGRLLDKDRQFITLMKQEEEASKPYIVESPRYGVDFARSTFNPYVNVDRRQEHLKKKREIDTRTLNTNFLSNPFPMFAQGGQRFYGVPRFDEGGTPMCKDSFGNPIPCPPGYTAGSMVFATATPAAQDNTRLPKRIEMTDKAAQVKAVSDAHAFNKAWMNSPMYNQMLQASIAASPSSSLDIPNTRKFAADPSRIDVQIEDLNNPDLGGTTSSQPTDPTKVSQIKLNPNSHFPFRDVAGHEILGHATDANGILIPQADKDKMNKYFTPVNNTKDPIAELAKGNNISYAEQKAWVDEKIKNDPQFAKDWKKLTELGVDITNITNEDNKYIQRPTETRARLMSVRKIAKERGVYDPLTQKMTRENLRKLKELDNDDLNSLFRNYTEDELLDMFNTISMNDSSDTQTMARWGGSLKKRSQGGMIEDDMGQLKYPGLPTRIRSKNITMEGVNHPLVAKTNRGITKLLLPNMKYEFEPMTQFVDEHPVPMIPQISNQTPRVMRNFGGEEPPQYINLSLPKMDQKRKKVEINPYIYYERPNPFVNVMGAGFQGNARLNNRWDLTGGMNVGRVNIPTENFSQYLKPNYNIGLGYRFSKGGQHGGLDRWFAEKWVDVKTGKTCGRQEGENRAYPACRPSKRVSSQTPKTSSEMSSSEKAKFKSVKQSSQRIPYNHKRK